jgi:hypothetical protein
MPDTAGRETLHGEQGQRDLTSQQFEVGAIRGDDRGPVASRGQSNQRIVLKVSSLAAIPTASISDDTDEPSCLPPVGWCGGPLHSGKAKEGVHEPLGLTRSGTPPELGQDNGRMADDECSSDVVQASLVSPALPVADIDAAVDDGPGHPTCA